MRTIPYREWLDFHVVTLEGHETGGFAGWPNWDDWTNVYRAYGIIGQHRVIATDRWIWYSVMKPSAANFKLVSGADMPANYRFDYRVTKDSWEAMPCTIAHVEMFTVDNPGNSWLPNKATGRYVDGVGINWDNYPISEGYAFDYIFAHCRPNQDPPLYFSYRDVLRSEVVDDPTPPPLLIETEVPSNFAASEACEAREKLFQNGIQLKIDAFKDGGGWCNLNDGNKIMLNVFPERLKVKYFNPIVNSFSKYRIPTAGADLILTGIGFSNDFDEINDLCGIDSAGQWGVQLKVSTIKFYNLDGVLAGTITTPMVEFTVDSDTQITIPAATLAGLGLAERGYHLLLSKGVLAECGTTEGYAGDWRTDSSGRMREGSRLVLLVADEAPPEDPPEIRTKWKWKKGDIEIDDTLAPQDTRGSETFYSGRLKNVSPFTRSIDDRTGLFSISDMNVTLANPDKKYSKLLAEYWLKNQIIEFYYGKGTQPEAWQTDLFRGIAYDYSLKGPHFNVVLKDIIQKYFEIKVPLFVCTKEDYPNIHESAEGGKVRPVVIGEASLIPTVASENSGAIEALYVDTVNHSYLAADFSLHSVTEVYSANVLKATPGDYVIAYRDGGRTYIDFTGDQGNNKITFNSEGCSVGIWDDPVNGFIQNPAYVISFLMTQLMGMPLNFLVMDTFDALAALYTTFGWHQSGFLVLQGEARDSWTVLQELLFTFGAKLWPAKDGRIEIGRKDISNFSTDLFFFEQIDLPEPPDRKYNLPEAVNFVNSLWNYAPAHSKFQGAMERKRQASIKDFGKEIMEEWKFPWTTSESMVNQRTLEELMKRSYGDPKVEFSVSMKEFIDDLDIFRNYRLQDPWGLSKTGTGEKGRYYYVESLTYDNQGEKIDVVGIDMQWLLRQYFVLGDENELANNWNIATESDKMFGYLCDEATNEFADGDPGKQLCDENLL